MSVTRRWSGRWSCSALAEENAREQQLGSFTAYACPQSSSEWLGTAVRFAGSLRVHAYDALRPLVTHGGHERVIAEQSRAA